mmetsp:Transcript_11960/g.23845  ORF Transcript_11960/g.23845 Transcript_11960/m.23845 type:complete len:745 (+) Transcript_11960:234-2468(+)
MMFAVLLIIATMFPIPAVIGKGLFPEEMGQGVSSPPLETQSPCLPNSPLLWFFVAFLIVLLVASFFFNEKNKRRLMETVWQVNISDLKFSTPRKIIGKGTFGSVEYADYRGRHVAVKGMQPVHVYLSRQKDKEKHRLSFETKFCRHTIDTIDDNDDTPLSSKHVKLGSSRFSFDRLSYSNSMIFFGRKSHLNRKKSSDTGLGNIEEGDTRNEMETNGGISERTGKGLLCSHEPSFQKVFDFTPVFLEGRGMFWKRDELTQFKIDFKTEMNNLSKIYHPCISSILGAVISDKEEPMLVTKCFKQGSLYDMIRNETMAFDGEQIIDILCDIADGMSFLHSAKPQIIHGDLKAQNVFLDGNFRAKVADFGLVSTKKVKYLKPGTGLWVAPEVLRGETSFTTASDVYAFGVLLYEVYSRKEPYEGEEYGKVLRLVADPSKRKRPPVPSSCPLQIGLLMKECQKESPKTRSNFTILSYDLKKLDASDVDQIRSSFSHQLKKKNKFGHDLLSEVFPKHIAEALKEGRKVTPETHEVVTIFFSDIVGFTDISAQLTPIKISDMLDRLYLKFDELSLKHDVFKVETIGDAYMATSNLMGDQSDDHTKRIAEFSIGAIQAANETLVDEDDPSKGFVCIRVGFHTGTVVSNVVGSRSPRYCLFGDTVNTAARMESNSLANRIQCSDIAHKVLHRQAPDMKTEERGEIEIKGKGLMKTYWVEVDMQPEVPCTSPKEKIGNESQKHTNNNKIYRYL